MKRQLKYSAVFLFLMLTIGQLVAQSPGSTGSKTGSTGSKTTKAKPAPKKAAPTVEGKAIKVTLKSLAEADISIFAGKKEDLKTGQLKNFGGLSTNTLYIKENDVVCIMKDKKPVSCADVKPGTTALEVNSSGNVITKK